MFVCSPIPTNETAARNDFKIRTILHCHSISFRINIIEIRHCYQLVIDETINWVRLG